MHQAGARFLAKERGLYDIPAEPEKGTIGAEVDELLSFSSPRPAGLRIIDIARVDASLWALYMQLPKARRAA
jgi:hypothetical protein